MQQNVTKKHPWWILLGVSIAGFLGAADYGIVNTAIPYIQQSLQLNLIQAQWIINSFLVAISASMTIVGKLSDVYGRRRIFFTGLTVFAAASILAGLAPNFSLLIIGRVFQAISAAILFTSSGAIVANSFDDKTRTRAMSIFWSIMTAGIAAGPVLSGFIIHLLNWHWIFYINVPFLLISLIICILNIPASFDQVVDETLDLAGFALLIIGIGSLLFGILELNHLPWHSAHVMMLFAISFISFISLILVELRAKNPLIDMRLFAKPKFLVNGVAGLALGFYYGPALIMQPLYLDNVRDQTAALIGLSLLPTTLLLSVMSPVTGWLEHHKFSNKNMIVLGFFLLSIAAFIQTTYQLSTPIGYVLLGFGVFGIGWGFLGNPTTAIALEDYSETMAGVILGILWTLYNIGATVGVAIGITVFHFQAKHELMQATQQTTIQPWFNQIMSDPTQAIDTLMSQLSLNYQDAHQLFKQYFLSGYHAAMLLLAVIALLAMGFVWAFMPSRKIK